MALDPITMELLDPVRLASLGSLHVLPDSLLIECILTLVGPKVGEKYYFLTLAQAHFYLTFDPTSYLTQHTTICANF